MATQERYPTGNSAVSNEWTAGTGGNKWDEVDDPAGAPDNETTYMVNANANQAQLFTFTPFAISPSSIESVSVVVRSRKETGTSYNTRARLLVNGTAYTINLTGENTSYATQTLTWTVNPNTGIAWTEADVEGTGANPLQEFGVNSFGQGADETIRVTQCYIVVTYTAAGGSTYNEALTLAVAADLSRTSILSAINALILAVASGQEQSGGVTFEEALTLAIASGQGQTGGISFEEAVSFAISVISVQSATTEMSASLSLGITADQGSGNTAEMDATIALSLAAAILQSESITGSPQTYTELLTIAAKMGMSRSAISSLQEAITLATSEGIGLTSQAIMVNALILQIVSSMDESFSVFVITTGNKLQFVFKKRKDHFTQ